MKVLQVILFPNNLILVYYGICKEVEEISLVSRSRSSVLQCSAVHDNAFVIWILHCLFLLFQARIKKIMQLDEEVGKVAATVPPVVCKFFLKI